MYCRFCGTNLSDNALFCTKCGKKLTPSEPADAETPESEIPAFSSLNIENIWSEAAAPQRRTARSEAPKPESPQPAPSMPAEAFPEKTEKDPPAKSPAAYSAPRSDKKPQRIRLPRPTHAAWSTWIRALAALILVGMPVSCMFMATETTSMLGFLGVGGSSDSISGFIGFFVGLFIGLLYAVPMFLLAELADNVAVNKQFTIELAEILKKTINAQNEKEELAEKAKKADAQKQNKDTTVF